MGLLVLENIKKILNKHLEEANASKVQLSTLVNAGPWKQTGRFDIPDFYKVKDHKRNDLLLAPTHEEEIVSLVKELNLSPKEFPQLLYQIGQKYRDERRPRGGLLRTREFEMMDLYSFDLDQTNAMQTYEKMLKVYDGFFEELELPVKKVEADMGDMGGLKSHEYQFIHPFGEDNLLICSNSDCGYAANEENAIGKVIGNPVDSDLESYVEKAISQSEAAIFNAAEESKVELFSIASLKQELLDYGIKSQFKIHIHNDKLYITSSDHVINPTKVKNLNSNDFVNVDQSLSSKSTKDFTLNTEGDQCHQCESNLITQQAIEVGHCFLLGNLYSKKLNLMYEKEKQENYFEMGCFGIGTSRLLQVVTMHSFDDRGIIWNKKLAPFKVWFVEIGKPEFPYENLLNAVKLPRNDFVLDDRDVNVKKKLDDAYLVGCPLIAVIGKDFTKLGLLEVRFRKSGEIKKLTIEEFKQLLSDFYKD